MLERRKEGSEGGRERGKEGRKEGKRKGRREGREKETISWSVNSYISFIFVFFSLMGEINEKCELPNEASLSELTYVQLELN